jgi:very-short-patch-repair endonuclease
MDVSTVVDRLGGIARTRELREQGCTRASIAAAVHRGRIIRLRIGWFGVPSLPDPVIRAHRVGGPPACATVAAWRGLWMLNDPILHVEVAEHDSRFRDQDDATRAVPVRARDDVVLHWVSDGMRSPRGGQPLVTALQHMATCVPQLDAICAIDSALQRGLVQLDALRAGAGPSVRRLLEHCDRSAESGVESIFRVRAIAAGFTMRTQQKLPGGGRVDFLFGDRLVIEVDGSEHHSGHEAFVSDRERDAWHAAIGYRVVRLTYEQVVHRWHEVESLLWLLHAHGEQFWPTRIRRSGRLAD